MATEGKLPMLGFKAAAIKFATLFGYSPNDSVAATVPTPIAMTGSHTPNPAMTGSLSPIAMTGSVADE